MKWFIKAFDELSSREIFDIFRLRELVFTIGQQCTEPDIDEIDLQAMHLFAYQDNQLMAYMRVYDKNQAKNLGRIVVNPDYQGQGHGRQLMKQALSYLIEHYPERNIEMSAQAYLQIFYQSLGFEAFGDTYQEAGIEHIFMRYQAASSQA